MLSSIDYTSEDGCSQTKLTCQEHVPERIVEQIIDVLVPLPILEETFASDEAPHPLLFLSSLPPTFSQVSQRLMKTIRRNTQKQRLQNSDQNFGIFFFLKKTTKKLHFENPA